MLIRLTGEQVAKYWKGMIKDAISNALPLVPVDSATTLNEILSQILQEKLQCWMVTDGKSNEPLGICTTQMTKDNITQERSMLIYTTYAFDGFAEFLWQENYLQLAQYATGLGCVRIYCYSDSEKVIKMAKECGADSAQTLLSFPLL